MQRDQFTFYRSYYEALKALPKKEQTNVLMAILSYALDAEEPKLEGVSKSVFTLVKPTIDSGRIKAMNRKNKTKTKQEQTCNKKEGDREIEGEIESENECYNPLPPSPEKSKTLAYYCQRVNPFASQSCIDELVGFAAVMGDDVCIRAIDIALDNRKANWSYIRAILQDKQARGVKCLADWDALEDSRQGGKKHENSGRKSFLELAEEL